jgi:hypothetical protein
MYNISKNQKFSSAAPLPKNHAFLRKKSAVLNFLTILNSYVKDEQLTKLNNLEILKIFGAILKFHAWQHWFYIFIIKSLEK